MKAATYSNGLPAAITSQMNGFNQHAASLIQSKNLLFNNFNTMQLQNQLRHQQLIQQQLLKLQLQQNQPTNACYQMVSPASSPKAMDVQQPVASPVNPTSQPMEQTPMQSPLNTSSSSSMELPIMSVQCSSVNTSCENSLIISPISTPNGSPVNCLSPSVTSSPLPIQSIPQQICTPLSSAEHYQTVNQLFNQNHENRPNKLNLMLPDGQLLKKCNNNRRKSNPKTKSAIKLENKFELGHVKNEKLNKKAKQRTAANERERKRMSNINQAFNRLRSVIVKDPKDLKEGTERLSKMEILKLAQSYIAELNIKLQQG